MYFGGKHLYKAVRILKVCVCDISREASETAIKVAYSACEPDIVFSYDGPFMEAVAHVAFGKFP